MAAEAKRDRESPFLKLHIDPDEPLELSELTCALAALSHQYQIFATAEGLAGRATDAKLLIPSVSHGSIDINLVPDFHAIAATIGPLMPQILGQAELIEKFTKRIKWLLDLFSREERAGGEQTTVRDCDDAINLVNPIAQHGGHQTFNIHNGPTTSVVIQIDAKAAKEIARIASNKKALLTEKTPDKRQRVSMIWAQLARDAAKTDGATSPDKAVIADLDRSSRPVFFTDETSSLKKEMIDDEENPYKKVFFVDVEVSRLPSGRIGNYKITGYHGKEDKD